MRINTLILVTALSAAGAAGCGPKLIPGSEIRDTDENREILAVVAQYRSALEARNVDGVLALVSPGFFENSGTPEGGDDYNYDGLKQKLTAWTRSVKTVRIDLQVKQIFIDGEKARAQYFYDLNYLMTSTASETPVWKRESDTKEMHLMREKGLWKITSGI
jgi:hypothetical protein